MMPASRLRTKSAGSDCSYVESYRGSKISRPSQPQPDNRSQYYAGAKFDTIPAVTDLPLPPRHWTDPTARSQSTPSSPVTIPTKPSAGISLDMSTLFGPRPVPSSERRSQGILKSASLPAQPGLSRIVAKKELKLDPVSSEPEPKAAVVFKTPQPMKARPTVKTLTKPNSVKTPGNTTNPSPATPKVIPATSSDGQREAGGVKTPVSGISGLDLMEMLLRASPTNRLDLNATPKPVFRSSPVKMPSPCHLLLGSTHTQYKEISDHLKSILKVSA